MCCAQWPLTLTYIFKVIQLRIRNKTAKICHILRVPPYSTCSSGWIISIFGTNYHKHERGVSCNDIWYWPIFSRSFSHDFAMKLLKYDTSCRVCSTTRTVLDELFPYLAQITTSVGGCVVHNDPWPWPIYSRLFSCDIAYFMDYIYMFHRYHPWGDNLSCTISRPIGQRSRSHRFEFLRSGRVYPSRLPISNF